jgi:hypothetical protein
MSVRLAIALVLLAFAPAFAQDADAPATLRPSLRADGPASSTTTATSSTQPAPSRETPAAPPVPAFSPIPPPPTPEQCRTRCAQDYYFCLADNEIQDCAPTWGQCRLACGTSGATAPVR